MFRPVSTPVIVFDLSPDEEGIETTGTPATPPPWPSSSTSPLMKKGLRRFDPLDRRLRVAVDFDLSPDEEGIETSSQL